MNQLFPDIIEKTRHEEVGMEYLLKITDEINNSNEKIWYEILINTEF